MTRAGAHALIKERHTYFRLVCNGRKTRRRLFADGFAWKCHECGYWVRLMPELRLQVRPAGDPCECGAPSEGECGICEDCARIAVRSELADRCEGHQACRCTDHVRLARAKRGRGLIRVNRNRAVTNSALDKAPF